MTVIKNHILKMSAYKPPLEGRNPIDYLLLDFNERTIPVSPKIKQAIVNYVNGDTLQVYPSYGDLTKKLAQFVGVQNEQIMLSNGSDQGIEVIVRATCQAGDEAIIPSPTFGIYKQCAQVENAKIISPPYTDDYRYPVSNVLQMVGEKTKLIVVANPNNPTGTLVPANEILELARRAPHTAILVDECYFEYTRITVKDYIEDYPNLFITRTFSKTWGLPSVRLGYIITAATNIEQFLKVRGPYDVNKLAVVAVSAALDDPSYMEQYVQEVLDVSKPMIEQYLKKKGIVFWPSRANFVLTLPPNPSALYEKLQRAGVLVRPKKDQRGKSGLRMTIGTKKQTERLIQILEEIL